MTAYRKFSNILKSENHPPPPPNPPKVPKVASPSQTELQTLGALATLGGATPPHKLSSLPSEALAGTLEERSAVIEYDGGLLSAVEPKNGGRPSWQPSNPGKPASPASPRSRR
jgi:hypothetical protein